MNSPDYRMQEENEHQQYMENKMLVMSKLQNVRVALQNTKLSKSGHNKFAGYKYFELGDFLPQVNELFQQVGLFSQVSYTADIATLTITCVENGSSVVFTSPFGSAALKGAHEIQNIGAVETYQRRYLYVTALEIVEHDALDSSKPVTGVIKATDGAAESISPERLEVVNKVASAMQDQLDDGNGDRKPAVDPDADGKGKLEACGSMDALAAAWKALKPTQRITLSEVKDECKKRICDADKGDA